MGYLQNIKSPDTYVRMMRAMLSRMPKAERDEACEEVRQHLEALVEDFQAEGHASQEALTLAIQQFGSPVKVGLNIWLRWERKRWRQMEAARPTVRPQRKFLVALLSGAITVSFVFVINVTDSWVPVVLLSALSGLVGYLDPCLYQRDLKHLLGLNEQPESVQKTDWVETQRKLRESKVRGAEQLSQRRGLRSRLNLLVVQSVITYLIRRKRQPATRPPASSLSSWSLGTAVWFMVVVSALAYWVPADHGAPHLKKFMLFTMLSLQSRETGRSLANRLLLRGRTT